MPLLPHQQNAIDKSISAFNAGRTRQYLAHAMSLGKTYIMASVKSEYAKAGIDLGQIWIIVPTDELVPHTQAELEKVAYDLGLAIKVGVEKAKSTADVDCDYVISSAQTLGRKTGNSGAARARRFSSRKKSILYDECHKAGTKPAGQGEGDDYKRSQSEEAIHNLGFAVADPDTMEVFPPNDNGLLMGVSGTPRRTEGTNHHLFGREAVDEISLKAAIDAEVVADLRTYQFYTITTLKHAKQKGEDFDPQSLTKDTDSPERNSFVVDKWLEKGENGSTVGYVSTRAHALNQAQAFRDRGIKAEALVNEKDPTKPISGKERKAKIDRLRSGETKVLIACGILREGFNMPPLRCTMIIDPTMSEINFIQPATRCSRKSEGKSYGIIISFKDVSNFNTIGPAILGGYDTNLDPEGGLVSEMVVPRRPRDEDGEIIEDAKLVGGTISQAYWEVQTVSNMVDALPLERESWVKMDPQWYVLRVICSPAPKGSASVYRYRATENKVPSWQMHIQLFKHGDKWVAARVDEVSPANRSRSELHKILADYNRPVVVLGEFATRRAALAHIRWYVWSLPKTKKEKAAMKRFTSRRSQTNKKAPTDGMIPLLDGKMFNMGQASAYLCRKFNQKQLEEQKLRVVDALERQHHALVTRQHSLMLDGLDGGAVRTLEPCHI